MYTLKLFRPINSIYQVPLSATILTHSNINANSSVRIAAKLFRYFSAKIEYNPILAENRHVAIENYGFYQALVF